MEKVTIKKKKKTSMLFSPEERRNLEEQMRSQSAHPILAQMRRQEDERRNLHDQEYSRRAGERYARLHRQFLMRRRLDALNNNVEDDRSDHSGSDRPSSGGSGMSLGYTRNGGLNDLFLIEAALLLSMQDQSRGSRETERNHESSDGRETSDENDRSIALRRNPLLRALMLQRSRETEDEGEIFDSPYQRDYDPLIRSGFLGEGFPSYSEDDQMEMAIALSLREAEAHGGDHRRNQRLQQERSSDHSNNNDNNEENEDDASHRNDQPDSEEG